MPKTDTSWGKVADWYEDAFSQKGSYQHELIYPNLLRMASPQKGERVFDVGCGGGSFSAELIAKGCVVFGADISPELILLAKKKVPKGIFFVSSAEDLSSVKEKDFDKAFIVLALQNIEKAGKAINEISRLLRPDGKLYVVLNHPCFRIPEFSEWGWNDSVQYRRIDRYLSESKNDIMMHPGSNPDIKTFSFHRPLQYFFKAFSKANLTVTRLEEWNSKKVSQPGPRARIEDRARKEIPLFMALECRKENR
jgi:ubiquinone/menaquinone biosynthesis C-methylase UbiE